MLDIPLIPRRRRRRRIAVLLTLVAAVALVAGGLLAYSGRLPAGLIALVSPTPTPDLSTLAPAPSPTLAAPAASPSLAPSPSPSPTLNPSFPPLAEGVVPILYLHRVVPPPSNWKSMTPAERTLFLAYDVLPAAFAADLDWLKANGYTTILPRDLAAHWDHGTPLPPRPVMITIDDGHPSWNATILPMLVQRGMVAEFYLTLDAIRTQSISWRQVKALADAGMGIGAHDVHHVVLAGPGARPFTSHQMYVEVRAARVIIREHIGVEPDSMAYVGGGFNQTLIALVKKAGYTTARSIIRGINQTVGNRFQLRVIAIAPHDDVADVYSQRLVPGLPTFVAKMTGVDLR
jgi:peptidoglycan/xylan/chitin deacetylase (PgdA/CDA1 family)